MSFDNQKYNFSGKVVLVTGSSSGIGAAIALEIARYGAQVAITGRDDEKLEKVAMKIQGISGTKPLVIIGDLLDNSFAAMLIEETMLAYGRLDVLVNNAGQSSDNGTLTDPELMERFDRVFKLNVRSVIQLTQLAVPYLEQSQGCVINISSIGAIHPYWLLYSSSKAALNMVTKTSALELGPKGIRVNSINPGPIAATEFGRSMGITPVQYDKMLESLASESPLNRVGQPKDIGELACFLASDLAANITGSNCVSDSGFLVSDALFKNH